MGQFAGHGGDEGRSLRNARFGTHLANPPVWRRRVDARGLFRLNRIGAAEGRGSASRPARLALVEERAHTLVF